MSELGFYFGLRIGGPTCVHDNVLFIDGWDKVKEPGSGCWRQGLKRVGLAPTPCQVLSRRLLNQYEKKTVISDPGKEK